MSTSNHIHQPNTANLDQETKLMQSHATYVNSLSASAVQKFWSMVHEDRRPQPSVSRASRVTATDRRLMENHARPEAPMIKCKVGTNEDMAKLKAMDKDDVIRKLQVHKSWQHVKGVELPTGHKTKNKVIRFSLTTYVSKQEAIQDIGDLKGLLEVSEAILLPDLYHVVAQRHRFSKREMKPDDIITFAEVNGFRHLRDVRFSFGLLVLSFSDKTEALEVCRRVVFLHSKMGFLLPFDIRGVPIFCCKCQRPNHLMHSCENPVTCGKCNERHFSWECNSSQLCCANCFRTLEVKKKNNENCDGFDLAHEAWSPYCKDYEVERMYRLCKEYQEICPGWGLNVYGTQENVAAALGVPAGNTNDNREEQTPTTQTAGNGNTRKAPNKQTIPQAPPPATPQSEAPSILANISYTTPDDRDTTPTAAPSQPVVVQDDMEMDTNVSGARFGANFDRTIADGINSSTFAHQSKKFPAQMKTSWTLGDEPSPRKRLEKAGGRNRSGLPNKKRPRTPPTQSNKIARYLNTVGASENDQRSEQDGLEDEGKEPRESTVDSDGGESVAD